MALWLLNIGMIVRYSVRRWNPTAMSWIQLRENAPERVVFNINALARTAKTRWTRFCRKHRKKRCFPRGKPEKCVRIAFSSLHSYAWKWMTIGLGAYSTHETHFRTFSVRESLTHCYISEQTPLAAPPEASCKKTHRAASSTPNIRWCFLWK